MLIGKKYHVYITTNPGKTVLYTGMTNNIHDRLIEHYLDRGKRSSFAGKYYCYNLLLAEEYFSADEAIRREKEIKSWSRKKKEKLITDANPTWKFLNKVFVKAWPPGDLKGMDRSEVR